MKCRQLHCYADYSSHLQPQTGNTDYHTRVHQIHLWFYILECRVHILFFFNAGTKLWNASSTDLCFCTCKVMFKSKRRYFTIGVNSKTCKWLVCCRFADTGLKKVSEREDQGSGHALVTSKTLMAYG